MRGLVQRHSSSVKGVPVICAEQPVLEPVAWMLIHQPGHKAPTSRPGSLHGARAWGFVCIHSLTAVKRLWPCGCLYWLVIYSIFPPEQPGTPTAMVWFVFQPHWTIGSNQPMACEQVHSPLCRQAQSDVEQKCHRTDPEAQQHPPTRPHV